MGACSFSQVVVTKGDHVQAYNEAVKEALHMHGHDPYNGSISTTSGVVLAQKPKGVRYSTFIEDLIENRAEKWGPAFAVELKGDAATAERKRGGKGRVWVLCGWAAE